MNTTFVRNSFVSPCCLAFSDKTPAAASNGARLDSISFSYNHGAPSYPGDVLADCSMHGYIPALDNGIAPESQSFALAISGRVDDQAIVSVDSNDTYASPSGAGVTLDGEITAVGAGYHSLYVKHINIAYPPNSNVSYINCTICGISPATPVPTDNDSEVTCTSTCPCSCSNGATEAGGQGGAARDADDFSSTSGGSEVSRSATANTMSWSCKFGSFRGVAGLPSARLEILAHHYAATLSTPAGLAVRHPFAMFLSIPQDGIQPNQLVRLNDGASYTNYMCAGDGNYLFTVGASQTSQTLLAPVNTLSLAPSAVCPLVSAQYIRASYKEGHAVFFSPLTGECVAFVSKFGNVLAAADALAYFAIVRTGQSGVIRQVWNLWDGLADIVPNESTGGYSIAIYPPDQVTPPAQEGGLFTVTGNPVKTFAVSGDAQTQSLTIAERDWTLPESMPDFVYSWNYAGNAWSTVTGEGDDAITETRTRTELQDNEYTVETILSKGGEESSHTVERYAATDVGKLLLSKTEAYGTDYALTTTYAYDNQGRVIAETAPNGAVTNYRYDAYGRTVTVTGPWGGNGRRSVETTYRSDATPYSTEPAQVKTLLLTASSVNTLRTDNYSYLNENGIKRVTVSSTGAGSGYTQVSITETYESDVENTFARGKVRMTQTVNGVQTWHEYAATTLHGALYTETTETRVSGVAVPGQSTRTVNFIDCEGNTVRTEQFVMLDDGTWALIAGTTNTFDVQNRLTGTVHDNGRSTSQALNCQGDLLWQIDEDGVRTDYAYNSARQLIETTRSATQTTPEIITEYNRDAEGHTLTTTTHTGAMDTVSHTAYDLAGRVISRTDILGRVTTTEYSEDDLTTTVTLPSGATLITTTNPDGSVAREYGTGQREVLHVYDFINGLRETVKLPDGAILSQNITDGFGQTITRTAPTTLANTYIYTRSVYNEFGQMTRQTVGDMAPTVFEYNSMGQMTKQTVLLDASAPADATKNQITEFAYGYESRADGVYQTTTITGHNAQGGELVTVQKGLVSQLSSVLESKSISIDVRGNTTTQWTNYGAPTVRMSYATIPTSDVTATATIIDGFTTTSTDNTGVTNTFTRAWTEIGMVQTFTDGRGNTTTTRTDIAGRTVSVTDAAGFTTTTEYCAFNDQPAVVTNALGKTSCYRYDIRSRKVAEFGTAMQPALFAYDDADNLIALTTFRVDGATLSTDPADRTDGDTTQWAYNAATGLEMSKTYPDNTQVLKTYDAMNRIATVTNARGTVQTRTYATATGLLTGITFSDSTTPQNFQYNVLGQLTQVTDAAGTRSFTYNQYAQPLTDSVTVGTTAYPVAEVYDAFGRSTGYALKKANSAFQTVAYGYDTKGQLSTCSFLHGGEQKNFTYNRLTGTHLLERLDSPNGMSRNYTYEPLRDLISTLNDKRGNTAVVNRSYTYNALGIPTNRTIQRQGTTRQDTFTHNNRNELTAATMGADSYAYDYDNIGNRKTAQETANNFEYEANDLNQYTQITENDTDFTPSFDLDGNQTRIKTTTGIWTATYNALNRPVRFENETAGIVITADYDYMGRRVFMKVETNDTVTTHLRFLYRGYLQIAALDLTRATQNAMWLITWDPTEPVATRPLAIQQSGTWYTYGIDLPKNVTELYGTNGYIVTAYTYSPYGLATSTGSVTQHIQWSSEYNDTELGLVYYNYRYYNPLSGRWTGRDPEELLDGNNELCFIGNSPLADADYLGLAGKKKKKCCKCGREDLKNNEYCDEQPKAMKSALITIYFGHCNGPLLQIANNDNKSDYIGMVTCYADSTLEKTVSSKKRILPNKRELGGQFLPYKRALDALKSEIRAARQMGERICSECKHTEIKITVKATDKDGKRYLKKAYSDAGEEKRFTPKKCEKCSCAKRGGHFV